MSPSQKPRNYEHEYGLKLHRRMVNLNIKLLCSKGKNISFPHGAHGYKFQFGSVDEDNV